MPLAGEDRADTCPVARTPHQIRPPGTGGSKIARPSDA